MFSTKICLLRRGSDFFKTKRPLFLQHVKTQPNIILSRFLCTGPCDPCGSGGGGGKHQISYKPYVPACYQDHDHKNMTLKRPMSPHLTIYAPTLPAMTSILQRITGVIVFGYALIISGGTLFLSNGIDSIVSFIQSLNLSGFSITILKFILGLPFSYHYFIGLRFCAWNAGKFLTRKDIYNSAYLAVALSIVGAVIYAML